MRLLALLIVALVGYVPLYAQDVSVEQLVPEVINTYPHDPTAYTQGLVLHEGLFYESTGLYGFSNLRLVDPTSGEVLQQVELPDYLFAEGLALVDDRLIQITWREGVALTYDLAAFRDGLLVNAEFLTYDTEGWGLCYDGTVIYMTDGSDTLFVRDAQTFEELEQIKVTLNGEPVFSLNELECVGDSIYANVWQTDLIVVIDKESGLVTARIDAAGLLTAEEQAMLGQPTETRNTLVYNSQSRTFDVRQYSRGSGAYLNGIAYNPESDTFFITGKLWPKMFEVRFIPQ